MKLIILPRVQFCIDRHIYDLLFIKFNLLRRLLSTQIKEVQSPSLLFIREMNKKTKKKAMDYEVISFVQYNYMGTIDG